MKTGYGIGIALALGVIGSIGLYRAATTPQSPELKRGLAALARCANEDAKCIGGYVIMADVKTGSPDYVCLITKVVTYEGVDPDDNKCIQTIGEVAGKASMGGWPAEHVKAIVLPGDPDFAAVKQRYEAQED